MDGWMDGRRDEHLTKNEQALVGGPVFSSEVLIKKKSAPKLRLRLKDTLSPPSPPVRSLPLAIQTHSNQLMNVSLMMFLQI
jgi:hypothetical protein